MEPSDPLLGYILAGKYKITDFVAEESLGRVYSAHRTTAAKAPVNIKVLHPNLVEDPEVFTRFGREMIATAAVEHPNTVTMLDFGEHRVFHYMVIEQLSARSLQRVLMDLPRLPWERVVVIMAQIASALHASHAEGIVHRSLSARNVLLLNNAKGDFVKLRDFGLAKLLSGDHRHVTRPGARIGEASYMAPEYIDHEQVTPLVDLYALGVLAFEMLTGQLPFKGTVIEVMEAHCDQAPPDPCDVVPSCPRWLGDLVLALMAKTPVMRPPSAAVVYEILEENTGWTFELPEVIPLVPENRAEIQAELAKRKQEVTEAHRTLGQAESPIELVVLSIATGTLMLVLLAAIVGRLLVG